MKKQLLLTITAPDGDAEKITEAVSQVLDYLPAWPDDVDPTEWDIEISEKGE